MALTRGAVQDISLGRGGTYGMSRDVIKHQLWDTRTFAQTATSFTFFTQPIGAPWRNNSIKTINETNLSDSGKLPNGQTFLVKRIGIAFISLVPSSGTDTPFVAQAYVNLIQSSVFEFVVAGRSFDFQVHGRQFLSPLHVHGANATNAPFRAGDLIASGWCTLGDQPTFLDQLVTFSVQMTLQNPDANVLTQLNADASKLNGLYCSMQCTLEGVLTRAK